MDRTRCVNVDIDAAQSGIGIPASLSVFPFVRLNFVRIQA
jgi:hypothetical protein